MLLPALAAAKEKGRSSKCVSNLRQLAIAFLYGFGDLLYAVFVPVLFSRRLQLGYLASAFEAAHGAQPCCQP
jgi:hypothetical protein